MKRCFGEAEAVETPIGWEPRPEDIDLEDSGVELDTLRGLLGVDTALWRDEVKGIREFYQKFGDKLPRSALGGAGYPGCPAQLNRADGNK